VRPGKGEEAPEMRRAFTFLLAFVAGSIVGNATAVFAALGIDLSYGESVTGGQWKVSLANVLYAIVMGLLVGLFAGLVARRKGWLAGVLAQFLPLTFVIGLSLAWNRVPAAFDRYESHPALWTWIGLIPAAIGGYAGQALRDDEEAMAGIGQLRWHWLWLWLPLITSVVLVSASIRFLLASILLEWQILFRPSFWLLGVLGLPLIAGFLGFTFILPIWGIGYLLALLSHEEGTGEFTPGKRAGLALLIVIGIPLLFGLIFAVNVAILNYFAAEGFMFY